MITLTQTYPTDLTTTEWEQLVDWFPTASLRGRPRKWATWLILNAILSMTRTGGQWRMLPRDFPPGQTVYGSFWRWPRSGLWARRKAVLVQTARHQAGRNPHPSAALIDSQSGKTSEGGAARGVEVDKPPTGRKRPMGVDVWGLLLTVVGPSAGIPEGTGGKRVWPRLFARLKRHGPTRWCRLKLLRAEGAYEAIGAYVRQQLGWTVEVVRRPPAGKGFTVLPRRWVVDRSFGWFGRYRRLGRDYEPTTSSSAARVYLASIRRTLRLVTTENPN